MTIQAIKKKHKLFCIYGLMLLLSGLFHLRYKIYQILKNKPYFTGPGLAAYQGVNSHHLHLIHTLTVDSVNFVEFSHLEKAKSKYIRFGGFFKSIHACILLHKTQRTKQPRIQPKCCFIAESDYSCCFMGQGKQTKNP